MIIVAKKRIHERILAGKKVGHIGVVDTEVTDRTQDLRHLDQAKHELNIGADIGHAVLYLPTGLQNPARQLLDK